MDSLTQAVLGAGIGGAVLGRFHGRKALLAGALLATLPDLDVLIGQNDPISTMIHHRGFSHSVLFLSVFAPALAWLWHRWRPQRDYGFRRLLLALWLILVTHPLLDAFTSYGTQLFWPLRPTPTSWSSIFIIDPFYTVPLAAAVAAFLLFGHGPRVRKGLLVALGWSVVYLGLSLSAKTLVEQRVIRAVAQDGITAVRVFSTPQPFSIVLWRVVVQTDDDHYVEAVTGLLDGDAPERQRLPLNSHLARILPAEHPLTGLRWFTDDWLRYDVIQGKLVVSDLRMGIGTGYYSFRFLLAEQDARDRSWRILVPEYWRRSRDLSQLSATMRRILHPTPPLPLARWEEQMHVSP
ncbi:MAG: metal-dependent hydrolase [Candidimonas sp.]